MNDSGQGLEAEEMWTFLERMNWTDPSLDFPSLVPSACEGLGLGREEAASGTAWIFAREGRRNSEPRNQEVGRLHRTQEGRKKHWEKNSTYEGQTYLSLLVKLGGHMLPAGIPGPDVEGRELYSLLLSHRERDSLLQSPLIPL